METTELIYDVGMNNGDDTAYYLHLGYRVVAVEADPHLVAACERRFANEIADGRLKILNCAVGPEAGVAKFWLCLDKPVWNSFRKESASRNGYRTEQIEVNVRRFGSILHEHGLPHYMKIDIEGHDIYCLEELCDTPLPKFLSFELGHIDEFLAVRKLGYDRFKLVLQGRHQALPNKTRAFSGWIEKYVAQRHWASYAARKIVSIQSRLGRGLLRMGRKLNLVVTPSWQFAHGSSGPFGNDAPGEWLNFEEACLRWLDYVQTYPGQGWCDVHASCSKVNAQASHRLAA